MFWLKLTQSINMRSIVVTALVAQLPTLVLKADGEFGLAANVPDMDVTAPVLQPLRFWLQATMQGYACTAVSTVQLYRAGC